MQSADRYGKPVLTDKLSPSQSLDRKYIGRVAMIGNDGVDPIGVYVSLESLDLACMVHQQKAIFQDLEII